MKLHYLLVRIFGTDSCVCVRFLKLLHITQCLILFPFSFAFTEDAAVLRDAMCVRRKGETETETAFMDDNGSINENITRYNALCYQMHLRRRKCHSVI